MHMFCPISSVWDMHLVYEDGWNATWVNAKVDLSKACEVLGMKSLLQNPTVDGVPQTGLFALVVRGFSAYTGSLGNTYVQPTTYTPPIEPKKAARKKAAVTRKASR